MLSKLVHTNLYKNVHTVNESVDGCMMACNDKIGRRTTTQQPTNEWRSGSSGSGGGGSFAVARRRRQRGGGGSAAAAHSATAAARGQQHGGCGSGSSAAAVHSVTAAGDEWGNSEGDGNRRHRTRGWHNERMERGNVTTSWARGTSMIQFLSCDTNLCELVPTNL
jgi:hypothetical protein